MFGMNQTFQKQPQVVEVEAVMVAASFGHEYAVINAKKCFELGENQEIDFYRDQYFKARSFLEQFYPERLAPLEESLRHQKALFLGESKWLH